MAKVFSLAVALLLSLHCILADKWPGRDAFNDICLEILNDVTQDPIHFRELQRTCTVTGWWWRRRQRCINRIQTRETLTRQQLCDRLTNQHNGHNLGYIGMSQIPSTVCQSALLSPATYGAGDWNAWAGKHCGTWYSTNSAGSVTKTFTDHATWAYAGANGIYSRQNVHFYLRTCCQDGWNESGGQEVVVWGWDPKDDSNHYGYQGSHVGYPFSYGGTRCIVWLTGEEAFLECIRNGRRTSAGFWGYGQWQVKSLSGNC